jgi:hypothetical protein
MIAKFYIFRNIYIAIAHIAYWIGTKIGSLVGKVQLTCTTVTGNSRYVAPVFA